jgi:hypothetical protein
MNWARLGHNKHLFYLFCYIIFSAIFEKMAFFSQTNVMIKFLKKTSCNIKKRHIFARFFGENILKS